MKTLCHCTKVIQPLKRTRFLLQHQPYHLYTLKVMQEIMGNMSEWNSSVPPTDLEVTHNTISELSSYHVFFCTSYSNLPIYLRKPSAKLGSKEYII